MLRKELEAKREADNYSFQPKILDYKGSAAKPSAVDSTEQHDDGGEPTSKQSKFDKLYQDAILKKQFQKEYAEKMTHTFTPTLFSRSQSRDQAEPSSIERLYTAPGAGRARDDSETKKKEPSFEPKITARASALERETASTPTKLYESAKLLAEKKREAAEKKAAEITFSPTLVSSEAKRAASASRYGDRGADVVSRSEAFIEMRKKHLESIAADKQQKEAEHATFQPSVTARAAASQIPSRVAERRRSVVKSAETFSFQPAVNAAYHMSVRSWRCL
jgi:hypothetical protein